MSLFFDKGKKQLSVTLIIVEHWYDILWASILSELK